MKPHISADVVLLKSTHVVFTSVYDSYASDKNVNRIYELHEVFRVSNKEDPSRNIIAMSKGDGRSSVCISHTLWI